MSNKGKHKKDYHAKRFCGNLILAWRLLGREEFDISEESLSRGLREAIGAARKEDLKIRFNHIGVQTFYQALSEYFYGFPKRGEPSIRHLGLDEESALNFLSRNCQISRDVLRFENVARVFNDFYCDPSLIEDYQRHKKLYRGT